MLIAAFAYAQPAKGKLSVTVFNQQKIAVEGATVELLASKDSSLVKSAICDKMGATEFENISAKFLLVMLQCYWFAKQLIQIRLMRRQVKQHHLLRCI